jgi:hypothetical protein
MEASISLYAGGALGPKFNFYGLGGGAVASVPESVRTVPIHPDDTYASPSDNGAIASKENRAEPYFGLISLEVGLKIARPGEGEDRLEKQSLALKVGLGADFGINGGVRLNERNYTNAPGTATRGYGAALTYYDIGAAPLVAQLVVVPKVFGELDWKNFLIREQLVAYETAVNTGWDRNDGLEARESYTLGLTLEAQTVVGMRWGADTSDSSHVELRLFGGFAFSKLFRNSLGETCGARTSAFSPIVGVEGEYTFNFLSF